MGPNNYLGRGYMAAPIAITVEGANILTRSLIIFGQGAIRCHPFVLRELQAAQDPDAERGLVEFDDALFSHIGYAISNLARSFFLALTHAQAQRGAAEHADATLLPKHQSLQRRVCSGIRLRNANARGQSSKLKSCCRPASGTY